MIRTKKVKYYKDKDVVEHVFDYYFIILDEMLEI
jgi:hypothetical protein